MVPNEASAAMPPLPAKPGLKYFFNTKIMLMFGPNGERLNVNPQEVHSQKIHMCDCGHVCEHSHNFSMTAAGRKVNTGASGASGANEQDMFDLRYAVMNFLLTLAIVCIIWALTWLIAMSVFQLIGQEKSTPGTYAQFNYWWKK